MIRTRLPVPIELAADSREMIRVLRFAMFAVSLLMSDSIIGELVHLVKSQFP